MSPQPAQTRIVEDPFAALMQGARLDSYQESGQEVHMEVQGLKVTASELIEREGKIIEKATCVYVPLKLNFKKVTPLKRADFFTSLANYPIDDPSRIIFYMHSWRQPGMEDVFYIFKLREPIGASMNFLANAVDFEQQDGGEPFTIERDWSPAPPMPDGFVPLPIHLHDQFGGDPVTIKINGSTLEQKLFVGGLEQQPNERPQVDAVLNIGESPSNWIKGTEIHPNDRVVEKGEGIKGMTAEEIRTEANWVIDHLKKDESVLVHCVAGMNRSITVCCAVLMLMEGLTAEEALIRVREQHPWAKPDSYHWLALRWLEKNQAK
jgi:dual specificity protein phosphatase-like protein